MEKLEGVKGVEAGGGSVEAERPVRAKGRRSSCVPRSMLDAGCARRVAEQDAKERADFGLFFRQLCSSAPP